MIFLVQHDGESVCMLQSHEGRIFRIQELRRGQWQHPDDAEDICADIAEMSQRVATRRKLSATAKGWVQRVTDGTNKVPRVRAHPGAMQPYALPTPVNPHKP